MKKTYNIEIDCAVCALKVENAIKAIDGVINASVNFLTQKVTIEANDDVFEKVFKEAKKAAKKIDLDFEIEE